MNTRIFWLLGLVSIIQSEGLYAQTRLSGVIMSEKDNQPVPFANLSVSGSEYGTSANENGEFVIDLSASNREDSIRVSAVGFEGLMVALGDLQLEKRQVLLLRERIMQLDKVNVTGKKLREVVRGKTDVGNSIGRMRGKSQGAQFGRRISTRGRNTNIRSVSTYVSCGPDSVYLRLRIYSFENGVQGEELLHKNVFVDVGNMTGWVEVDVSEYNIWTDRDFIIGFEWLTDNFGYPMIGLGGMGVNTYYRLGSHGKWLPIKSMNWAVNATLWVE